MRVGFLCSGHVLWRIGSCVAVNAVCPGRMFCTDYAIPEWSAYSREYDNTEYTITQLRPPCLYAQMKITLS